ncbi:unnamed protein product [Onchocerca flexuosa]|uniref:OxoGdeHyase_C domain-containing protein n=1 Tax=Onchocerca flexuosa TaxID=387005 RepID=A0A183H879_9BILA|nr:unnamed protein product [Onchocerca flexuosa]
MVILYISGKVYYDLVSARKHLNLDSRVAICRVEQISPFPYDLIEKECLKYDKAELIWSQEEHKNMGAWGFVHPRLKTLLAKQERLLKYAGRKPSASPATGNKYTHYVELKSFIADALNVRKADLDAFICG